MKKPLTVGELKKIMEDLPDNAPVVRSSGDHNYKVAEAESTTALNEGRGCYTEDYGEEVTPESEHGDRTKVLLIV